MSVLAIIQARVGSARLPAKVLAPIEGVPLVAHIIRRAKATVLPMDVCLAIPSSAENDPLAAIGEAENVRVYRGDEGDVLGRFFSASQLYPQADVIVRITADDAFVDPVLIDMVLTGFLGEWANPHETIGPPQMMEIGGPTWPVGLGVRVFTRGALESATRFATEDSEREHCTNWIERTYGCWTLKNPTVHGGAALHWSVDTAEDLAFAREVYAKLYAANPVFGFKEMVDAGYCVAPVVPQADGCCLNCTEPSDCIRNQPQVSPFDGGPWGPC